VKIPDELDFEQAAAAMLQGMTAHYLIHSSYPLKKGETALIHAAAGGVGLLLVQMAKKIGARVIPRRELKRKRSSRVTPALMNVSSIPKQTLRLKRAGSPMVCMLFMTELVKQRLIKI
jgi:D-arabinose 1-dehydrogenase-like Zn-dependent alcohol dehydrogenase